MQEALDYLADRDPRAAEAMRAEVFRILALLDARVMEGSVAKLRSRRRVLRFYVHPLWIFYERGDGEVLRVLRFYHHARRPLR